jgi:hypothetical protein
MSRPLDPYQVLGVAHDADAKAVRQAYLALAKRHHPDAAGGAAARFKDAAAAFEVLGDPKRRALHDDMAGDGGAWSGPVSRRRNRSHGFDAAGARAAASARRAAGGGRGAAFAEVLIHPYIAGPAVALAFVGFLFFGSTGTLKAEPERPKVAAWLDPATKRWTTPAPWDPRFRHDKCQLVDRASVVVARQPPET